MINQAMILGRVGKINNGISASGIKYCNMSMVTSKKLAKNGVKEEKVTWHNITLFSKLAEIAENYVNIGDLLFIRGEFDNHKYTDKDGVERIKYYIIGHEMTLMPKTKEHKAEPKNDPYPVSDDAPW